MLARNSPTAPLFYYSPVLPAAEVVDLRGEVVGGKDAARAGTSGEVVHLPASVHALEALVAEADVRRAAGGGGSHGHTETLCNRTKTISILNREVVGGGYATLSGTPYGWEGLDGLLRDVVPGQVVLTVVDCEPALGSV